MRPCLISYDPAWSRCGTIHGSAPPTCPASNPGRTRRSCHRRYDRRPYRVLETSHPPNYYVPPGDIRPSSLLPCSRRSCANERVKRGTSTCVQVNGSSLTPPGAMTARPPGSAPSPAVWRSMPHGCPFVDDERVVLQPGGFYGAGSPPIWQARQMASRAARAGRHPGRPAPRPRPVHPSGRTGPCPNPAVLFIGTEPHHGALPPLCSDSEVMPPRRVGKTKQ
jgi:Domain of unknown function (DUF427)